ncbi:MAG: 50S ribosomal protein L7ae [Candidatus Aenigmarchaeota archaeon]|nr:50S ribosomal protein L7ae [Candidatus Aenigmarchaeota archaeon]
MTKDKDILEVVEVARDTGKIRRGVNEVTKSIERGEAKLVIAADDVDPPEIVMHLPVLCNEKKIAFVKVPTKSELGRAAGIDVGCSTIAVAKPGEAKKQLDEVLAAVEKGN